MHIIGCDESIHGPVISAGWDGAVKVGRSGRGAPTPDRRWPPEEPKGPGALRQWLPEGPRGSDGRPPVAGGGAKGTGRAQTAPPGGAKGTGRQRSDPLSVTSFRTPSESTTWASRD